VGERAVGALSRDVQALTDHVTALHWCETSPPVFLKSQWTSGSHASAVDKFELEI
jgi:hypothetical protein